MGAPSIEAVIVSMANAAQRRDRMRRIFADAPFPWRFEDASTGDGAIVPYDGAAARFIKGRDLYGSELGCFESHVGAIRRFVEESDHDFLLMSEDDVLFDFAFPFGELAEAMRAADVGYVRLYSRRIAPARHLQFWRNRWLVRFMWEPFGTQCYMVSKAGARQLLPFVETIRRPIDDQLDRFWENGLPPYAIFPYPAMELQSSSSIVRLPAPQSAGERIRHKVQRLWDRIVAFGSSVRLTAKDRAFVAALRKAGI